MNTFEALLPVSRASIKIIIKQKLQAVQLLTLYLGWMCNCISEVNFLVSRNCLNKLQEKYSHVQTISKKLHFMP